MPFAEGQQRNQHIAYKVKMGRTEDMRPLGVFKSGLKAYPDRGKAVGKIKTGFGHGRIQLGAGLPDIGTA